MTVKEWEYEYVGRLKKRRKVTPQMRALRARRVAKKPMATPVLTRTRIDRIANMMANGTWNGRSSIYELAREWEVSVSRVDQLVAEVKRGRYQDGKAISSST